MKKRSMLLAALLALCVLFASCGGGAAETETAKGSESAGESESARTETETEPGTETEETEFDFRGADYGKILAMTKEDYTGKTIPVPAFPELTEQDLDDYILSICAQFATYPDAPVPTGTVKKGDGVLMRMRLLVDGEEIADACNYASDPDPVTVGNGEALPEIEAALLGAVVEEHAFTVSYDRVEEGSVVYVSFLADGETLPNGCVRVETENDRDACAALAGKASGEQADMTVGGKTGVATVLFTVSEHPISAIVAFDENVPEFAGKTGEFLISIDGYYPVSVPAFDEDFILNTAKVESELRGDELIAEQRAIIFTSMEEQWKTARDETFETAVMDYFREHIEFREVPEELLASYRNEIYAELHDAFSYYSVQYASSFPYETEEEFAPDYFGTDLPLAEFAEETAQYQARGMLILYGVATAEELLPDDVELLEAYEAMIREEIAAYAQEGYTVTKEEMEAEFGRDVMMRYVEQETVYHKTVTFLFENNTLAETEE